MVKKAAKKIQHDNQSEAPLPENLVELTTPRSIDIETFREARRLELDHFVNILKTSSKLLNKLSFQLLPKHMRRRAMSHNSYRVPARVRVKAHSTAYLQKKTRRARRHTNNMLADYARRNKEFKWLETHIWHAKRMKMSKIWGWSVPICPNDKAIRAIYRFARTECVMIDHSYYSALRTSVEPVNGCSMVEDLLHNVPVEIFPFSSVILVHPSSVSCFEDVKTEDLTMQVTLFRLRGPKSAHILSKVLNIQDPNVRAMLEENSLFNYTGIPDKKCFGFVTTVPTLTGKQPSASREFYDLAPFFIPPQPNLHTFQRKFHGKPEPGVEFWNSITEGFVVSNAPTKVTTRSRRSRYTVQKEQEKAKAALLDQEERAMDMQIEAIIEEELEDIEEEKEKEKEVKIDEEFTKGMLVYRKGQLESSFSDGWDLYLPAGKALVFWRSLIYAGAKAIGQRDFEYLLLEQGKRSFPKDYPGTPAYETHLEYTFKEHISLYLRRPPAKRPNYFRLGFPVTLPLQWSKTVNLQPISLKTFRKVPKQFALICMMTEEDVNNKNKRPIHTESLHQIGDDRLESIKDIEMTRKAIGFVTSSCYSFVRCKGFAIGVLFPDLEVPETALFRNHTSRHYHLCKINKLIS